MRSKTRVTPRQTSLELLKILAAAGIVGHHFILYNGFNVFTTPLSINTFFLEAIIFPGGKTGVFLFFAASSWFLSNKHASLKLSLRKLWILEREVLFWSLSLLSAVFIIDRSLLSPTIILHSLFPMSTNMWWYVTSYGIFLLIHPYLNKGLQLIGRQAHAQLCIVMFTMWSLIAGFNPFAELNMADGITLFVYLYTLISFLRWHTLFRYTTTDKPSDSLASENTHQPKSSMKSISFILLFSGFSLLTAGNISGQLLFLLFGSWSKSAVFLASSTWKLPIMLIGFGALTAARNSEWRFAPVNIVAKSSLAVYLITEYPPMREILWKRLFNLSPMYNSWFLVAYTCGVIVLVVVACFVLDSIRRGLFMISIDRNPGKLFDFLTERLLASNLYRRATDLFDTVMKP